MARLESRKRWPSAALCLSIALCCTVLLTGCPDSGGARPDDVDGADDTALEVSTDVPGVDMPDPDAADLDAADPDAPDTLTDTLADTLPDGVELCGNGVIDGAEACDGAALGGASCASLGFVSGTLGCAAGCASLDTSSCVSGGCGDGVCDATEDAASCAADCGVPVAPLEGELVFTELMLESVSVPFVDGEWVELQNVSQHALELQGCELSDGSGELEHRITSSLVVAPGDVVTLARSAAPGFVPDQVAPYLHLVHTGDGLVLRCDARGIDAVHWSSWRGFPRVTGASIQLDPGFIDSVANNEGEHWCVTTEAGAGFVGGDAGNPGLANPPCPQLPPEHCTDGLDNDFDTLGDCEDSPDCDSDPTCHELACTDGLDNEHDGLADCLDLDCVFDVTCRSGPPPGAGQMVFTELMVDPVSMSVVDGQWFELQNVSNSAWDLEGCELRRANGGSTRLPSSVPVPAGSILTLSRDTHPGFPPDVGGLSSLGFFATTDGVALWCDGVEVDSVRWDPQTFPVARGASMQLRPGLIDAVANDDGDNWCHTSTASANFTSGDAGNPDIGNPPCPVLPPESCADEVDNDRDGYLDCEDVNDCAMTVACAEVCGDGEDNDHDGEWDCFDEDCAGVAPCGAERCDDGLDNDADTTRDCADPDCAAQPYCGAEACGDGLDNDGDGRTDCEDEDCYLEAFCRTGPLPTPGSVIITEVMSDPEAMYDNQGSWLELHNRGATAVDLLGCELARVGSTSTTLLRSNLTIASGGLSTIATGDAPGFVPDAVAPGAVSRFSGLVLRCDGADIDEVAWTPSTFPIEAGASMQLSPGALDAASNDDPANWCVTHAASLNFTSGDLGNPGQANPPCPVAAPEVCTDALDNDLDQERDCADSDCFLDPGCRTFPQPAIGAVIVSEVMADPSRSPFDIWLEVHNVGSTSVDLLGCEVRTASGTLGSPTIFETAELAPGQSIVIAERPIAGLTIDARVDSSLLHVSSRGVQLRCGTAIIDVVDWFTGDFPIVEGASMQLSPGAYSATANDDPANWCVTTSASSGFTTGDSGNPGLVSPPCPVLPPEACADGLDNDLDSAIDCADSDCSGESFCGPEVCADGVDNDGDGRADCSDTECLLDGACRTAPMPPVGSVILTEILPGSSDVSNSGSYSDWWFELENVSGTAWDLMGCEFGSNESGFSTIQRPVPLGAGERVTIAATSSPGFIETLVLSLTIFPGSSPMLLLRCDGVLIDAAPAVPTDGSVYPGISWQLSPGAFTATANDDPANWCNSHVASVNLTNGDLGNPGQANPPCPVAAPEVCTDRIDNDLDGLLDCADADACTGVPLCREMCTDDIDEDGDGLIDCDDFDCTLAPACIELSCSDGVDEDGDDFTDCDDFDCRYDSVGQPCGAPGAESGPAACTDGLDNDNNGFTDCGDWSCSRDINYTFCL